MQFAVHNIYIPCGVGTRRAETNLSSKMTKLTVAGLMNGYYFQGGWATIEHFQLFFSTFKGFMTEMFAFQHASDLFSNKSMLHVTYFILASYVGAG